LGGRGGKTGSAEGFLEAVAERPLEGGSEEEVDPPPEPEGKEDKEEEEEEEEYFLRGKGRPRDPAGGAIATDFFGESVSDEVSAGPLGALVEIAGAGRAFLVLEGRPRDISEELEDLRSTDVSRRLIVFWAAREIKLSICEPVFRRVSARELGAFCGIFALISSADSMPCHMQTIETFCPKYWMVVGTVLN